MTKYTPHQRREGLSIIDFLRSLLRHGFAFVAFVAIGCLCGLEISRFYPSSYVSSAALSLNENVDGQKLHLITTTLSNSDDVYSGAETALSKNKILFSSGEAIDSAAIKKGTSFSYSNNVAPFIHISFSSTDLSICSEVAEAVLESSVNVGNYQFRDDGIAIANRSTAASPITSSVKFILLGALVGILLGIFYSVIFELYDNKIRYLSDFSDFKGQLIYCKFPNKKLFEKSKTQNNVPLSTLGIDNQYSFFSGLTLPSSGMYNGVIGLYYCENFQEIIPFMNLLINFSQQHQKHLLVIDCSGSMFRYFSFHGNATISPLWEARRDDFLIGYSFRNKELDSFYQKPCFQKEIFEMQETENPELTIIIAPNISESNAFRAIDKRTGQSIFCATLGETPFSKVASFIDDCEEAAPNCKSIFFADYKKNIGDLYILELFNQIFRKPKKASNGK